MSERPPFVESNRGKEAVRTVLGDLAADVWESLPPFLQTGVRRQAVADAHGISHDKATRTLEALYDADFAFASSNGWWNRAGYRASRGF